MLGKNTIEQADIMAKAGAQLIVLEMMSHIDRMLVTLEGAQTCRLPVWPGLSCEPNEDGEMCLLYGDKLEDAVVELAKRNVPLISIMHTEVKYIHACLDILEKHWDGPVGVYAHTGGYDDGDWVFEDMISPTDYAVEAREWAKRGVQVLGGCCGIRKEHICELGKVI